MSEVDYEERIKQYERNGQARNLAIVCTKVEFMEKNQIAITKKLDAALKIIPSIETRSKYNSRIIIAIIIGIVILAIGKF